MEDAEASLLSAALAADAESILTTGITPEDFSTKAGGVIWRCLLNMASERRSVDPVAVISELGVEYRVAISDALQAHGVASNVSVYAGYVRKASRRRQAETMADQFRGMLQEQSTDQCIGWLLEQALCMTREQGQRVWDMPTLMAKVSEEVDTAVERANSGNTVGIPTGIKKLDEMLSGLHNSDLIVVAGRPGMGKTAFMLSCAARAAKRGHTVGMVSAEMSAGQLGARMVAAGASVGAQLLRSGHLTTEQLTSITRAMSRLRDYPLRVMDPDQCTPGDIVRQAHVWKAQGMECLWVDYLGRLKPDRRSDSRTVEVGEMANSMKSLAKSLDIPVVLLSQLNRQCEQRPDKRPHLGDLRDSGEIEQEADSAMFLYREWVYNRTKSPEAGEILVAKNRHGPVGDIQARYIADRMVWAGE